MTESDNVLEPAIPQHLRLKRSQPLQAPADFKPRHASYSARFKEHVVCLPMLYLGVQYRRNRSQAYGAFLDICGNFDHDDGPCHWDTAWYEDEAGYGNFVAAAYWDDRLQHDFWKNGVSESWWYKRHDLAGELGFFLEAYTPSIMDTETTFSHPYPEGYAIIADRMSGRTDTHEYWGSARDRLPRSQTDPLLARSIPEIASDLDGRQTLGRHVRIKPHENLCLLRSGQDWSETGRIERAFYFDKVKPYLDKGMMEIRDKGAPVGCFFNRYMTLFEHERDLEKSYSLSAWHSLAELEAWVQAETHLAIWGAGIRHYNKAGDHAKLRLYHEMFVLRVEDQAFEYFNCNANTGMLNAIHRIHAGL